MSKTFFIAAGLVGLGSALYLFGAFDGLVESGDELPQGPSAVDQAISYLDPNNWNLASFYGPEEDPMQNPNVLAFLQTIRYAEGTSGPGGYSAIFRTAGGPNVFTDFSDHPRVAKSFKSGGKTYWTSAAGAYQLMAVSVKPDGTTTRIDTWDRLKAKLGLTDFSPASQDRAAIELISECGALNDVKAGRFEAAINKCRGTWASLPGAPYGQPTKAMGTLRNVYAQAGGSLASA
jgi:lysozyme